MFGVERDLRQRIKARFDEAGVEIPFPRQVVYHRQEPDAERLTVDVGGAGPSRNTSAEADSVDEERRAA